MSREGSSFCVKRDFVQFLVFKKLPFSFLAVFIADIDTVHEGRMYPEFFFWARSWSVSVETVVITSFAGLIINCLSGFELRLLFTFV
jgi:hypothetical protein